MRVLLVEDDEMLGRATRDGLSPVFAVDWCRTVGEAELGLATVAYDLTVLDIALPDGSGLDLLKAIRRGKQALPVLLLTARDSVASRIEGLNAGADDYLIKPFDLDELIARCRALVRRSQGYASGKVVLGTVTYDPDTRSLTQAGLPVYLSAREQSIFACLMDHLGKVVSKATKERAVYNWDAEYESNTIEVHISGIRRKLGKDLIRTVKGAGYMIPSPQPASSSGAI